MTTNDTFSHPAWQREVLRADHGLGLTETKVLIAISTFADFEDGKNARPGIEQLMDVARCSRATVRRALKKAEDLGIIKQTSRGGRAGDGSKRASVYQLQAPSFWLVSTAQPGELLTSASDETSTAHPRSSTAHLGTSTAHPGEPLPSSTPSSTSLTALGTGKSAGDERRSASGSPATGSSSKADLPSSASSAPGSSALSTAREF